MLLRGSKPTKLEDYDNPFSLYVLNFFIQLILYEDSLVIESIQISICRCLPAARQLVSCGLFPCAPQVPSLAVDIRVLEFVSRLFLNIAPNTTAWCKTVEGFLESQGYRLFTKVYFVHCLLVWIFLIAS